MDAVLENDTEVVCDSLEAVVSALRTMKTTLTRIHERLPSSFFYNEIRPFLSGYGGKGSKIPEGIIFDGACDVPISVIGGSAAQSSPFQCFDVGLGICHGNAQKYLDEIRTYMPPAHADFISALAQGPSIKDYVASSDNNRLKEKYADCISAMKDFRSYHIQIVTKYVMLPAKQKTGDESLEKGTGGTDIIPFLKGVRDTTNNNT
jgi:indoleamine 2,3-dioxygenase